MSVYAHANRCIQSLVAKVFCMLSDMLNLWQVKRKSSCKNIYIFLLKKISPVHDLLQVEFRTPCLRPTAPAPPGQELRVIREFSQALLDHTGSRKQACHDDFIIPGDVGRGGGGLINKAPFLLHYGFTV